MAKINFPTTRGACNPVIGSPGNTDPLQNGDKTNITVDSSDGMPGSHNVTITYMFVKPASPNTDSWWKSMGRVNKWALLVIASVLHLGRAPMLVLGEFILM